MSEIDRKIKIPPRRRSAVLSVKLEDGREVKATVNATSIRVTLPSKGGYGAAQALALPRNGDDLEAVRNLIDAAIDEISDQDEFARIDRESREGAAEGSEAVK